MHNCNKTMYIISFDIGIHNFSFSLIHFSQQSQKFDITYFENADLAPQQKINKDFRMSQSFFHRFHEYLKSKHHVFCIADICIIEKQLTRRNIKASCLYTHLETHLIIFFSKLKIFPFSPNKKYLPLLFVHPDIDNHKKNTYRERKDWAVTICKDIMRKQNDDVALEWLDTYKKKDDICDTIISTFQYLRMKNIMTEKLL